MDVFASLRRCNFRPIMTVGLSNMDLTRYLIRESLQSHEKRMKVLQNYFPDARSEDWTLQNAGQRVQIIKRKAWGRGELQFGTEIVAARDNTMAALLGASPGASTAAGAMLEVLERCFAEALASSGWQKRLKEMIPSYGQSLVEDVGLLKRVRTRTLHTLGLSGSFCEMLPTAFNFKKGR